MFLDQARIFVQAGKGGNGSMSFRREKYAPLGGPNGGNGGRGAHVILVAERSVNTLFPLHNQVHYRAESGTHGSGADKTGANGTDLRIPVPLGTIVHDAESGAFLGELLVEGQELIVAKGGRGGRGNTAFKSARNKAPRLAEKGEPGHELWLEIELKLVADVGIIGVPNAGKSTLLSVISAAKPKIAAYPFTTVAPALGVAEVDHKQIVVADIPGLLEGAHEGVGLGLDFLRHIERTRLLIHVVSGDSPDPLGDFEAINQELVLFNPDLVDKPQIVVLNKMDLPDARAKWDAFREAIAARGLPVYAISGVTRENVDTLLYKVRELLDSMPADELPREGLPEISPQPDERRFEVFKVGDNKWYVEGVAVERAASMTNWAYYESGLRFQRILRAMGVTDVLRNQGVEDGDIVRVGDVELVWGYDNAFEDD